MRLYSCQRAQSLDRRKPSALMVRFYDGEPECRLPMFEISAGLIP